MSSSNITKYCFCLTRKMTRMIEPPHISNVLHDAQSNRCRPPPSPNTAPDTTKWSCPKCRRNARKQVKRHLQGGGDPRMIRTWSEHETVSPQPASQPRLIFGFTTSVFLPGKNTACGTPSTIPNSPSTAPHTKMTRELHQMLRLPPKVTLDSAMTWLCY